MLPKELHQLKYEAQSVPQGSVRLVKKTQERKSSTCYLLITKGVTSSSPVPLKTRRRTINVNFVYYRIPKQRRLVSFRSAGLNNFRQRPTNHHPFNTSRFSHPARFQSNHEKGLLPTEVSHIIAREPDDKANSYEHVKDLLLKRFKITPEKFRQLFVTHQKASERTWIDFYHELNTYFNGWIDGLKIDTFNKLSDLIITDQLKRKTPFEFKEYYLDEWANMNSPVQIAEKLEEFEDFKRTLKQKSSSPFVKKQEFKSTEKNRRYEAPGKFEYNRKDKKFPASANYNKHYEAPVTKYESVQRYQDSGYYNKNYEKHSNHNASKHAKTNYSKSQKFKEPPKETCTLIVKEG
ncbi:uncharacterized protein TNCV_687511 [Trichonephila clavipes]|nr:uncharacterized protein TNCV_687511 [Trichonephila clavipes]